MTEEENKDIQLNRFTLAEDYRNMSPKRFLEMLRHMDKIEGIKGAVQYISDVLKMIKTYAAYQAISFVKGVISPFGKKQGEADIDYDWTKTSDFESQMKGLWNVLDINDGYFDPVIQDTYHELSDILLSNGFEKDTLDNMTYNNKYNTFGMTIFNKHHNIILIPKDKYAEFQKYAKSKVREVSPDFCKISLDMTRSGNYIIDADDEIVKSFMIDYSLKQSKDIQSENTVDKNESAPGKEKIIHSTEEIKSTGDSDIKGKDKSKEKIQDKTEEIGKEEKPSAIGKWSTIASDDLSQGKIKSKLLSLSPEERKNAEVEVTMSLTRLEKDAYIGNDKIAFRVPKGYKDKETGKFVMTSKNVSGAHEIVLVPKEYVREVKGQTINPKWHNNTYVIDLPVGKCVPFEIVDYQGTPVTVPDKNGNDIPATMDALTFTECCYIHRFRENRDMDKTVNDIQDLKDWVDNLQKEKEIFKTAGMDMSANAIDTILTDKGLDKELKEENISIDRLKELSQTIDKESIDNSIKAILTTEDKTKDMNADNMLIFGNKELDKISLVIESSDITMVRNNDKSYRIDKIIEPENIKYDVIQIDDNNNPINVNHYIDIQDVIKEIGTINNPILLSGIEKEDVQKGNPKRVEPEHVQDKEQSFKPMQKKDMNIDI